MKPRFSIIIPIYKVEDFLHKCVDSLLCQDYSNVEITLVDDGSPDSCPQICDDYDMVKGYTQRNIYKISNVR